MNEATANPTTDTPAGPTLEQQILSAAVEHSTHAANAASLAAELEPHVQRLNRTRQAEQEALGRFLALKQQQAEQASAAAD